MIKIILSIYLKVRQCLFKRSVVLVSTSQCKLRCLRVEPSNQEIMCFLDNLHNSVSSIGYGLQRVKAGTLINFQVIKLNVSLVYSGILVTTNFDRLVSYSYQNRIEQNRIPLRIYLNMIVCKAHSLWGRATISCTIHLSTLSSVTLALQSSRGWNPCFKFNLINVHPLPVHKADTQQQEVQKVVLIHVHAHPQVWYLFQDIPNRNSMSMTEDFQFFFYVIHIFNHLIQQ